MTDTMSRSSFLEDMIRDYYNENIQTSVGQAVVIGQAIVASGPGANVLVFGCGNDSMLWHKLNRDGYTLFLESAGSWLRRVKERWPRLNIERIKYGDRTVESSLPIDEQELQRFPIPPSIGSRQWDVVIIDAPNGHKPTAPGRSLPIFWTSLVASEAAHVFVDDYDRPLERAYVDHFLCARRPWSATIPRSFLARKRNKAVMLWSIGAPSRR